MSNQLLEKLMQSMDKIDKRMSTMEKTVVDIGSTEAAASKLVRKALGGYGNNRGAACVGYDGAETANLLALSGSCNKVLGMTSFMRAVEKAMIGGQRDHAERDLEQMGSKAVNKTALGESSGFTGGYTVPIQFYQDLLRLAAEESPFRSKCFTIPMQSRSILIPALDQSKTPVQGTSAFWGGLIASWQPEQSTINESEPTFRNVELIARDLVFYTVASNQLLQDNAVALDTLLTTLFREAMSWFSDYYILRGNGVAQPLGVLNSPATYVQSRGGHTGHVTLDSIAAMVSRLLVNSWKNCCWVMHPSVIPDLIQLTNGATNSPFLIYMNPAPPSEGGPVTQALPMMLMGFPVYFSEKVPSLGNQGDISLIDFSKQLVGDRLALQIEANINPRFTQNQTVWRIVARWDSRSWLNSPITMADGAYQMAFAVTLAA